MSARRAFPQLLIAVSLACCLTLTVGPIAAPVAAAQGDETGSDGGTDPGESPDEPAEDDGAPEDGESGDEAEDVPVEDQREDSLSAWWFVVAIVAGVASVAGITMAMRRRRDEEAWDQAAANLCNAGRTVLGAVHRLDRRRTPSAAPDAARERLRRFSVQVDQLAETAPHERAEAITTVLSQATRDLRQAISADGSTAETDGAGAGAASWDDVDLAAAALDAALVDLEREAMLGAAGASHPSGRPST